MTPKTISQAPSNDIDDQLMQLGRTGDLSPSEARTSFQVIGAAAARAGHSLEETMSTALAALGRDAGESEDSINERLSLALSAIASGFTNGNVSRIPGEPNQYSIDSPLITRLNALHRISRAATITTSSTEYLRQSIEAIIDATHADAATVFVFDRPTNTLTLAGQHGFEAGLIGTMSIRGDRGIIGRVMESGKAVFAGEVKKDPDWIRSPALRDEVYQAQASLPMKLANPDRLVGVATLWMREPPEVR